MSFPPEHGAGADQTLRIASGETLDRLHRLRRIERDFENAKTFTHECVADRVDLGGRNAAQHGDKRQRGQKVGKGHVGFKES